MALAAALAVCLPLASWAAAPSCNIERIASLPIEVGRHLALAQVKINGNPAWMGIDTGAQTTLLTQAAAARLGLPHDPRRRTNIVSAAGATLVQNVHISDMQFGDTIFSDLSVAAVTLDQPYEQGRHADGLIGADILSHYDVELDFAGATLNLYEVSDCARLQPPWQGAYAAVPVVLSRTRLLLVPAQIDGRDVTGLFDSGSDRERVERSAALRIGITDAMLARDRETGGFSAGGPSHPMRMHRFSALRIGNETFPNPMLEVGSLPEADADMLVGLDYMRARRFWLSYATRWIFIQHPAPP